MAVQRKQAPRRCAKESSRCARGYFRVMLVDGMTTWIHVLPRSSCTGLPSASRKEGGVLRFEMSDGWQGAYWDCDAGLLQTNHLHHIVVVVDGRAKAITFVVDGILNDGGAERQFGFGRFNPTIKDVSGGRDVRIAPMLRGELRHVRLYNRALRISEAVGNHRALAD